MFKGALVSACSTEANRVEVPSHALHFLPFFHTPRMPPLPFTVFTGRRRSPNAAGLQQSTIADQSVDVNMSQPSYFRDLFLIHPWKESALSYIWTSELNTATTTRPSDDILNQGPGTQPSQDEGHKPGDEADTEVNASADASPGLNTGRKSDSKCDPEAGKGSNGRLGPEADQSKKHQQSSEMSGAQDTVPVPPLLAAYDKTRNSSAVHDRLRQRFARDSAKLARKHHQGPIRTATPSRFQLAAPGEEGEYWLRNRLDAAQRDDAKRNAIQRNAPKDSAPHGDAAKDDAIAPYSAITPGLWIGTSDFTATHGFLAQHPVTAVLSVMHLTLADAWATPAFRRLQARDRHLFVCCHDSRGQDMLQHFGRLCAFFDAALGHPDAASPVLSFDDRSSRARNDDREESPDVFYTPAQSSSDIAKTLDSDDPDIVDRRPPLCLVHCQLGRSRSVTAVIAYLMRKTRHTRHCILEKIRAKRGAAKPSANFMQQLKVWEQCGYEVWEDEGGKVPKQAYAEWIARNEKARRDRMTGQKPGYSQWTVEEREEREECRGGVGGSCAC